MPNDNSLKQTYLGFTLAEVVTVVAILVILLMASVLIINPVRFFKEGRDKKRLSDLAVLDRMISEYLVDNGSLPDVANATRTSNALPTGQVGPYFDPTEGWIVANFTQYNNVIPVDPLNSAGYYYIYRHDGLFYELNATLEAMVELAEDDSGDDNNMYEVGSDLSIL